MEPSVLQAISNFEEKQPELFGGLEECVEFWEKRERDPEQSLLTSKYFNIVTTQCQDEVAHIRQSAGEKGFTEFDFLALSSILTDGISLLDSEERKAMMHA